jgi:hypothetical protein
MDQKHSLIYSTSNALILKMPPYVPLIHTLFTLPSSTWFRTLGVGHQFAAAALATFEAWAPVFVTVGDRIYRSASVVEF